MTMTADEQEVVTPISAPPVPVEHKFVTVHNGSLRDQGFNAVFVPTAEYMPMGRLSVVLGARGTDQYIVRGAVFAYEYFTMQRDALLKILSVPAPMRVGYFEFIAVEDEGVSGPAYEVMYLSQESVLGISVELFYPGRDDQGYEQVPVMLVPNKETEGSQI